MATGFWRMVFGTLLAFKEDIYWPILCRNYVWITWYHQSETSGEIVIECLASSRQCAPFISHLLHSKLFATVNFFNWTTQPTVQIWLLVTTISPEIWNLIFLEPSLQMMNCCCWSVVWRAGQRILFSRHKQLIIQELIIEMRNPNVTWRIVLPVYLFTTELRHTCIVP